MKIYCEHGALTPELRAFQRDGRIALVHFPYDPGSQARHISPSAMPSDAQWRDLNTTWSELTRPWDDFKGSEHYQEIIRIVGPANRRDALHVDSAYKSGCAAIVTADTDILAHKAALETLLGLRVFHPVIDGDKLHRFIEADA
jgi:hypothetical protein